MSCGRTLRSPPATALIALWAALSLSGCRPPASTTSSSADPYACAPDEFSVMTFNLGRYSLDDRDGDGQKNDAKPEAERQAVIGLIADARPDVLTVVELGGSSVFEEFQFALRNAGLDYPQAVHKLQWLIDQAFTRRLTGVQLKDESDELLLTHAPERPCAIRSEQNHTPNV